MWQASPCALAPGACDSAAIANVGVKAGMMIEVPISGHVEVPIDAVRRGVRDVLASLHPDID